MTYEKPTIDTFTVEALQECVAMAGTLACVLKF